MSMIKNFGDHSANERTFLAWVRTAITVMAFGFLVERFDLFLMFAAPRFAERAITTGQAFGNVAGLSLIVLGTAMITLAAMRFLRTSRHIDSAEVQPGPGARTDITLAFLLVLLGCSLFLYLSHAVTFKI